MFSTMQIGILSYLSTMHHQPLVQLGRFDAPPLGPCPQLPNTPTHANVKGIPSFKWTRQMTASRHRVWGKRGNRRVPLSEENTAGGPIDVRNGLYFRGCGSLFFFTITASGSEQARDQRVFLLHHPLVPSSYSVHIVIPNCIYPCSRHPEL